MAVLAIEAVKVKLDATGEEVVYEPQTDLGTLAAGVLVETVKGYDTITGKELVIEAGSATVVTP